MEDYIQISFLNDFIFCPRSIYFHQLHGKLSTRLYHSESQILGKAAHQALDQQSYSTSINILQGVSIYSEKYKLCGKIDQFDVAKAILTERKKKIKIIYDGFILQLYAQYFCLIEMGYEVKELRLYSCDDNKVYKIKLPQHDFEKYQLFEDTINQIQSFEMSKFIQENPEKCKNCVYNNLCDQSLC